MKKLGKVTMANKKGTFLVRSTKPHRIGIQVVNQEIKRLGKVVDVIGPAAAPYIVINTRGAQAQTKKGDIVYLLDKPPQKPKHPQQNRSGKPRYSKKSYSKK
ncbi:MAG: H/ACA ribonucleoprotein complex subunit GAR1 [Candidatus Heimdallarchaeota archaeon]